jgi:hypothetical protein
MALIFNANNTPIESRIEGLKENVLKYKKIWISIFIQKKNMRFTKNLFNTKYMYIKYHIGNGFIIHQLQYKNHSIKLFEEFIWKNKYRNKGG